MSKTKLDNLGVSAFCESMAMMLHSSIQTDEAVGLLLEDNAPDAQQERKGSGVLEEGLKVMKQKVDEGLGLSVAMEESGIFPDYALKMVQAGEKSGHLENILFGLARYYKDQTTISAKIRNAVTYPAAMLVLIIVVLAAMLRLVLPAFTDVYDKLTGSLAASSYGYIRLAFVFCRAALIVMIVLAAGLLIGRRMWQGEGREGRGASFPRAALQRDLRDDGHVPLHFGALDLYRRRRDGRRRGAREHSHDGLPGGGGKAPPVLKAHGRRPRTRSGLL